MGGRSLRASGTSLFSFMLVVPIHVHHHHGLAWTSAMLGIHETSTALSSHARKVSRSTGPSLLTSTTTGATKPQHSPGIWVVIRSCIFWPDLIGTSAHNPASLTFCGPSLAFLVPIVALAVREEVAASTIRATAIDHQFHVNLISSLFQLDKIQPDSGSFRNSFKVSRMRTHCSG